MTISLNGSTLCLICEIKPGEFLTKEILKCSNFSVIFMKGNKS